jgi:hypothetical protein
METPQKDLDHTRVNSFDITEYEENFIPNPTGGPWESDDQFDTYHCFDFFDSQCIQDSIAEFKALVQQAKLPNSDYQKIEDGIQSFTTSSTALTKEKALLFHSILNWQPEILTSKFYKSDEEIQQTIRENYFENFQYLQQFKVPPSDLIPPTSLEIYRNSAELITLRRLNEWVQFSEKRDGDHAWAHHFNHILIYRGINNSKYYEHGQKKGDLISVYTGAAEDESFPYFEKYLFSSYTLSPNLAEQFMVGSALRKSQRRALIEGHTEIIESRIFTSFVVSPNFRPRQFEFICLPDTKFLKIRIEFSNEIYASLTVHE